MAGGTTAGEAGGTNGTELEDVFCTACSRRDDSSAGKESAKACEIARERALLSGKLTLWDEAEVTIEVEADVVEVELSLELDGEAVDGVTVDKLLFVVRIVCFAKTNTETTSNASCSHTNTR